MEGQHKTPVKTIRAYCVYCNGGNDAEVRRCDANKPGFHICHFHPYRMGRGRPSVKVIRKFCLQCMGDSRFMVQECETRDCFCHPYRMGRNPARLGMGCTDAERMRTINPMSRRIAAKFERSATGEG